jgi:hypothetical protein
MEKAMYEAMAARPNFRIADGTETAVVVTIKFAGGISQLFAVQVNIGGRDGDNGKIVNFQGSENNFYEKVTLTGEQGIFSNDNITLPEATGDILNHINMTVAQSGRNS